MFAGLELKTDSSSVQVSVFSDCSMERDKERGFCAIAVQVKNNFAELGRACQM